MQEKAVEKIQFEATLNGLLNKYSPLQGGAHWPRQHPEIRGGRSQLWVHGHGGGGVGPG